MTKKIMLSITLAALIVMVFGVITSGAWFTDSVASNEIQIKLGVLAPRVVAAPFTISNAAPGIPGPEQTVEIFNDGESTLAVKYKISPAYDGGSGDLYNNLWVKVERPVWNGTAWTREQVYNGWLRDLSINPANSPSTARLGVGESHKFFFTYTPNKDLGNEYQGLSTTLHLVFDATQVENPGW